MKKAKKKQIAIIDFANYPSMFRVTWKLFKHSLIVMMILFVLDLSLEYLIGPSDFSFSAAFIFLPMALGFSLGKDYAHSLKTEFPKLPRFIIGAMYALLTTGFIFGILFIISLLEQSPQSENPGAQIDLVVAAVFLIILWGQIYNFSRMGCNEVLKRMRGEKPASFKLWKV